MNFYPCGTNSNSVKNIMDIAVSALSTKKINPKKDVAPVVVRPSRETR